LAIARFSDQLIGLLPAPDPAPLSSDRELTRVVSEKSRQQHASTQIKTSFASTGAAVGTVVLRWSAVVHDLDLHIIDQTTGNSVYYSLPAGEHSTLGPDAFDGGPESAVLHGIGNDVAIEVHLYSGDVAAVRDAAPTVEITTLLGAVTLTPPDGSAAGLVWSVATVRGDGTVVPHP
jgi:uncharacterized protein YfaP (DUF2135 family)